MERLESSTTGSCSIPTIELKEPHKDYLLSKESMVESALAPMLSAKKAASTVEGESKEKKSKEAGINSSPELPKISTTAKPHLVDCIYKSAGCKVKLPKGSMQETEHYKKCQFRPIPCLMQHVCNQLVPYPNFLLHHMKHFLTPTFSPYLSTTVYFEKEDFHSNNRWQPRWMNCYNKDFFVLISHKLPGLWYFWIWMLGTVEEAEEFFFDIELSKGDTRKTGTFPVLSLRTTTDEIEKIETLCLTLTDYQIRQLSQIRMNLVGSFGMELVIYKHKTAAMPSRMCLM